MFQRAVLCLLAALAVGAFSADRVSAASFVLSTQATETLDGLTFDNQTAVNFDTNPAPDGTASVNFDGSVLGVGANIDALSFAASGDFVFSTQFDSSISWNGGNDSINFLDGDLVRVASDGSASILLSESVIGGDIDAVHVRANGNIVFSTQFGGTLGALSFSDGDIVEFDPNDISTAAIIFDDALYTSAALNNTNAVSFDTNGNLVMAAASAVTLGGITYDAGDLFSWDGTNSALVLDGAGPFQLTSPGQVDAVHFVPEPGTLLLFGLGLCGLAWHRRARD